jgi:hypothetical protein
VRQPFSNMETEGQNSRSYDASKSCSHSDYLPVLEISGLCRQMRSAATTAKAAPREAFLPPLSMPPSSTTQEWISSVHPTQAAKKTIIPALPVQNSPERLGQRIVAPKSVQAAFKELIIPTLPLSRSSRLVKQLDQTDSAPIFVPAASREVIIPALPVSAPCIIPPLPVARIHLNESRLLVQHSRKETLRQGEART